MSGCGECVSDVCRCDEWLSGVDEYGGCLNDMCECGEWLSGVCECDE